MLGVPPALANTKFPVASSDVIGREPPDARAKRMKETISAFTAQNKYSTVLC